MVITLFLIDVILLLKSFLIDGKVTVTYDGVTKTVTLEILLLFLNGARTISPGDGKVYNITFLKPLKDCFPRPAVSTCSRQIITTLADDYDIVKEVWTEAVAQLTVGFLLP